MSKRPKLSNNSPPPLHLLTDVPSGRRCCDRFGRGGDRVGGTANRTGGLVSVPAGPVHPAIPANDRPMVPPLVVVAAAGDANERVVRGGAVVRGRGGIVAAGRGFPHERVVRGGGGAVVRGRGGGPPGPPPPHRGGAGHGAGDGGGAGGPPPPPPIGGRGGAARGRGKGAGGGANPRRLFTSRQFFITIPFSAEEMGAVDNLRIMYRDYASQFPFTGEFFEGDIPQARLQAIDLNGVRGPRPANRDAQYLSRYCIAMEFFHSLDSPYEVHMHAFVEYTQPCYLHEVKVFNEMKFTDRNIDFQKVQKEVSVLKYITKEDTEAVHGGISMSAFNPYFRFHHYCQESPTLDYDHHLIFELSSHYSVNYMKLMHEAIRAKNNLRNMRPFT